MAWRCWACPRPPGCEQDNKMSKKQKKPQRGGTILGFIIGAMVGLGAALAVALYVTKVPVPFMNKGATRAADQDVIETNKNKDWDPNSPLYGKNPARPPAASASGAVQGVTPPATAATPAPPTPPATPAAVAAKPATAASATTPAKPERVEPKTAETKPADPKPTASADPLGDLARAKSGNPAVDPFDYFVQAGAFRSTDEAEAQRAKLAMMGWQAKITEREQSGRTVYRVRVGPFSKKDDAEGIKEKFESSGVESALVRVQR